MLETIITSKTRLRLLIKFFINIANKGYLNELANEFDKSTNSVRKELNNLSNAGFLKKQKINNKVEYRANVNHPLFAVLQEIVHKHLGFEKIIENIFDGIGSPEKIVLIGDYAKGIDSGLIEVLIIGYNINIRYLDEIKPKIERQIKRKIRFIVSKEMLNQRSIVIFES